MYGDLEAVDSIDWMKIANFDVSIEGRVTWFLYLLRLLQKCLKLEGIGFCLRFMAE